MSFPNGCKLMLIVDSHQENLPPFHLAHGSLQKVPHPYGKGIICTNAVCTNPRNKIPGRKHDRGKISIQSHKVYCLKSSPVNIKGIAQPAAAYLRCAALHKPPFGAFVQARQGEVVFACALKLRDVGGVAAGEELAVNACTAKHKHLPWGEICQQCVQRGKVAADRDSRRLKVRLGRKHNVHTPRKRFLPGERFKAASAHNKHSAACQAAEKQPVIQDTEQQLAVLPQTPIFIDCGNQIHNSFKSRISAGRPISKFTPKRMSVPASFVRRMLPWVKRTAISAASARVQPLRYAPVNALA